LEEVRPIAEHPGWWKMMELCNSWWLRMGCYVVDYVKGCNLCNHAKTFPASPTGKLMPNWIPACHWKFSSVDLIMPELRVQCHHGSSGLQKLHGVLDEVISD